MKTFKDLKFKQHQLGGSNKHARLDFENGYGVSVVSGPLFYTDFENPYEVAVMKNGDICYDSGITEDVFGHLDEKSVEDIMIDIQKLNKQLKKDDTN